MPVYERGYRAYDGPRRGAPGWWTLWREHLALARRRRGPRWLSRLIFAAAVVAAVVMYVEMGLLEGARRVGAPARGLDPDAWLAGFYGFGVTCGALACLLVGAGLLADDLRTRALPLYLVRPITPAGYALGKGLVLPALVVRLILLPGVALYLLAGLWQPPGESVAWLLAHRDTLGRVLALSARCACYLTGLMLWASSISGRRGSALAIGGAVSFAGLFAGDVGRMLGGTPGHLLRALDLLGGAAAGLRAAGSPLSRHAQARLVPDWAVWTVALGLLVLGALCAWRRARSVEVTG